MRICKIDLEIELKREYRKSSIEDIYNIIREDIEKYAEAWRIPSCHIEDEEARRK
jgi:hypothetical protein